MSNGSDMRLTREREIKRSLDKYLVGLDHWYKRKNTPSCHGGTFQRSKYYRKNIKDRNHEEESNQWLLPVGTALPIKSQGTKNVPAWVRGWMVFKVCPREQTASRADKDGRPTCACDCACIIYTSRRLEGPLDYTVETSGWRLAVDVP